MDGAAKEWAATRFEVAGCGYESCLLPDLMLRPITSRWSPREEAMILWWCWSMLEILSFKIMIHSWRVQNKSTFRLASSLSSSISNSIHVLLEDCCCCCCLKRKEVTASSPVRSTAPSSVAVDGETNVAAAACLSLVPPKVLIAVGLNRPATMRTHWIRIDTNCTLV